MNPDTNKLEPVFESQDIDPVEDVRRRLEQQRDLETRLDGLAKGQASGLLRADGSPVPAHWPIFTVGETVVLKGYTFRVAHLNESTLVLEPVGLAEGVVEGG